MKHTLHECLRLVPDQVLRPHHCLYWMFLENVCIYSHVIGLVTHMLDCHDLVSAGRASEGI